MSEKQVIAIDLGAESGRVVKVMFDGARLNIEETHRFPSLSVNIRGTLYWDALRLYHEILTGIDPLVAASSALGIDTWGVDYGLLDRQGNLLANPVHYRDTRTDGMFEWVFERVPRRTVFERTGVQFMQLNTLYQLGSMVRDSSPVLEHAATFLNLPDLFNYWLGGEISCEFTHVTTTQCYDPRKGDWDRATLDALGVPTHIFPKIVQPGTQKGTYRNVPVIAPGCHDTASAVVAVPTTTSNYAYISSGTWSLLGLEVTEPVISDAAYEANVTNEGGAAGTFRFLKNVTGLWLVQQCRAAWREAGTDYDYESLARLALEAKPFVSFIDPDDSLFFAALGGDMPTRIREFCKRSNQALPETPGQFMRLIYESLALKYRLSLEKLIALSGRTVERVHIIGGGARNALLNQMTADATNRPVIAGPFEATAMGNAIVQYITLGELGSVAQAREMLSRSVGTTRYEPKDAAAWEAAFQRFKGIVTTT